MLRFLKIIKSYEGFALFFYSMPGKIHGQIWQFQVSQKHMSINSNRAFHPILKNWHFEGSFLKVH